MLVEKELSKDAPAKNGSNYKCKYQSKEKKASSYKEVHAINSFTKYTLIGTTYTQALEKILAKGKINLPEVKAETNALKQSKSFDPTKYYKCYRSQGHGRKNCWTFKNRLERMFKSGYLPFPKAAYSLTMIKTCREITKASLSLITKKRNGILLCSYKELMA